MSGLPKPFYEDGSVTIFHGDCRELLPEIEAEVLVTDPPYGINHFSGRSSGMYGPMARYRMRIAGDENAADRDNVLRAWGSRPALVFGTWKVTRPNGTRAVLIWDKTEASGMGDLSLPWKPSHEEIYVLGKGFTGHRGGGVLRVYTPPRVAMGRRHPNEKPVDLLRSLIAKCPEGTILDPFMGSGTTLRAAKDLGRKAIGIELEERYCEIAAERCSQEVLDLGAAA